MFSSTFLSGGNPLSAMSSAVNKFSLFGDESGQDKQQEAREQKDTKRQQDGVLDTQGPPKESKPQQPGVGMGEAGMGGPQRQDMGKALPPPKGLHGGGAQQQDPPLCPICKNTELNFISKGPPNHNTCTQCKSAVCRLCGFSPPDAATEWLCLNCQMQRAVGGVEPPTPPTKKLPTQPSKGSTPSQPSGKRSPSPAPNKDTPPGKGLSSANQQTKLSDSQKPSGQSCSPIGKRISATTAPALQQTPSQQQTANETPSPVKSKLSTKTDPPVEQSGFFGFGFGSAHGQSRATSPSPQPPVSAVSEKVLGFGSSFFSSASNLISSAVQDEKSTTASKDSTKPLASQAPDEKKTEQKKSEETQPTKATVAQTKNEPTSPQPQKADRSSPKPFPQSCPICKVDLKKDPPNYNTCTECKNIVCTQCGFNPMPHQSEGKDWLCLNCQTQRALQSEGTHLLKPQPQPQDAPTQVKDAGPKQKQTTAQPSKSTSTNKTSTSKEDPRNQNAQQKPPTHQTAKSNLPPQKGVPPQEDSGFFRFGFGGARSRSPSPQPAVSAVSGRVLGFGSSFLSSASNLISSAVQDEPSTTPSTSCKGSTVSQNSASATSTPPASHKESAAAQRAGKETKPSTTLKEEIPGQQNDQQPKTPLTEAKMPELSLYMPKLDKDTQPLPKACPLSCL
ncbi:protein bassoon-like [Electrophorus electricus]|uniref:protein bassoon-like n=1 Tax=Electrophorus electricus TaxID=8005 RepID=UPI0015CFDA0A|nr:protein bassoon-like [Electrophorus electricus]